jgi:hypothetical protein
MTHSAARRRVMVVTGSRAEFGLLEPVMHAVRGHAALDLAVVVAGSHLVAPGLTWRDVEAAGFAIVARVPMQEEGVSEAAKNVAGLGSIKYMRPSPSLSSRLPNAPRLFPVS